MTLPTITETVALIKRLNGLTVANAKKHLQKNNIENTTINTQLEKLEKSDDGNVVMFYEDMIIDGEFFSPIDIALHPRYKNQQLIKRWSDDIVKHFEFHDDESVLIYFKKSFHEFLKVEKDNGLVKKDGECYLKLSSPTMTNLHEFAVIRNAFDSFVISRNIQAECTGSEHEHQKIMRLCENLLISEDDHAAINKRLLETNMDDVVVIGNSSVEFFTVLDSLPSITTAQKHR